MKKTKKILSPSSTELLQSILPAAEAPKPVFSFSSDQDNGLVRWTEEQIAENRVHRYKSILKVLEEAKIIDGSLYMRVADCQCYGSWIWGRYERILEETKHLPKEELARILTDSHEYVFKKEGEQ